MLTKCHICEGEIDTTKDCFFEQKLTICGKERWHRYTCECTQYADEYEIGWIFYNEKGCKKYVD